MMFWHLALRNVLRNKRRTLATVLAIGLSCAGLVLFGGYVVWAHLASETHAASMTGHLQLFQEGFRSKGAGNPAAYAIASYDGIKRQMLEDEVIGPLLEMVTGQLLVQGMVSSADRQTSTAFLGIGAFPEDLERLARWNPHGLADVRAIAANAELYAAGPELDASDPEGITLGVGLARILDIQMPPPGAATIPPAVELISQPPSGGMANMVSATVRKLSTRPLEELDNRLVFMPLPLASSLLFPGEQPRVTSIILLLKDARALPVIEARLSTLRQQGKLGLEWRNCWDLNPNNVRSVQMMDMFFLFAFCIISVVLIFTIYNTMMMSVMERVREIGTGRAIGLTRSDVIRMFTIEGLILGIAGSLLGLLLAITISAIINRAEILYIPPMVTMHAKLEVLVTSAPDIMAASFFGCLLVALLGAFFPARRASRMVIIDALRT
ncbi:MAG: FtsX-like permease family protein [Verrucomicrobiae bacterium]